MRDTDTTEEPPVAKTTLPEIPPEPGYFDGIEDEELEDEELDHTQDIPF